MQRTSLLRLATIASFSGLLASAAMAQDAPPPPSPAPMHHAQKHDRHLQDKTQYLQQRQAQRWERMKNLLQLQPQQQAAWDAYVAAMQPPVPTPPQADAKHPKDMTTLERLDWKAQMRKTHQKNADQRDQATRKFYTSLNPQQQKAFDSLHQDGKRMMRKHHAHPKM